VLILEVKTRGARLPTGGLNVGRRIARGQSFSRKTGGVCLISSVFFEIVLHSRAIEDYSTMSSLGGAISYWAALHNRSLWERSPTAISRHGTQRIVAARRSASETPPTAEFLSFVGWVNGPPFTHRRDDMVGDDGYRRTGTHPTQLS
jgi:hypothetical protein